MAEAHDNIESGDEEVPVAPHHDAAAPTDAPDPEFDEYLKRFEKIDAQKLQLTQVVKDLDGASCGDERIAGLVQYARKSDAIIQEMYTLLVEMNNIFGAR